MAHVELFAWAEVDEHDALGFHQRQEIVGSEGRFVHSLLGLEEREGRAQPLARAPQAEKELPHRFVADVLNDVLALSCGGDEAARAQCLHVRCRVGGALFQQLCECVDGLGPLEEKVQRTQALGVSEGACQGRQLTKERVLHGHHSNMSLIVCKFGGLGYLRRTMDALFWHRLQFAFTIVYHYLFPQLTMGLALLIVVMKWRELRGGREDDARIADFWTRVFGVNFVFGVVTGIPMEFQFGTNWARFSEYAGGVIGQTLAMEGMFAFFLESSFLGLLLFGRDKLSPRAHFATAVAVFLGSWLSGYFIVATNAFMQHPVGYTIGEDGRLVVEGLGALLLNPWAVLQYAHTMVASVVTACFVVSAVNAFWLLRGKHTELATRTLRISLVVGLVASVLVAFPTGDLQAKAVARYQPVALAAMEGRFESGPMAEITLIGQPNVEARRLDNPIRVPGALSFLAMGTFHADVPGLDSFPEDTWPHNIELLYYSFHVMAGLGTLMMALMALALVQHLRGKLPKQRSLLWVLTLSFPFPYIATTAGWMTAELGRQPWLVYGLFRTTEGASPHVHAGNAIFSLVGFAGLYFVLGLLYVFLMLREVSHGPHAPKGARGDKNAHGGEGAHGGDGAHDGEDVTTEAGHG